MTVRPSRRSVAAREEMKRWDGLCKLEWVPIHTMMKLLPKMVRKVIRARRHVCMRGERREEGATTIITIIIIIIIIIQSHQADERLGTSRNG